ncbi:AmmeMemoRadiSam system protein A [Patescibacteria group bacterium]|nr:AmmeMemoRadiSam system protein A [Patescibacteria group bacterium]
MHQYPTLAQQSITNYLCTQKIIDPPADLSAELLANRAGCFVTLHQKNGELRGCIGTITPVQPNLALEIIHNAVQSATADPRFPALTSSQLADLEISVDVLSEPELIREAEQLDPKKYGVIIKTDDGRTGLLLPDLEGVDDAKQQMRIASQKGGINIHTDNFSLYRFSVTRYK